MNELFELGKEVEDFIKNKEWTKNFLRNSTVWEKQSYIDQCILYESDSSVKTAIFCKRIKDFHKFFVQENGMEEDRLRNIINIMIDRDILLTKANILSTNEHIELGFYTNIDSLINEEEEDEDIFEGVDLSWIE